MSRNELEHFNIKARTSPFKLHTFLVGSASYSEIMRTCFKLLAVFVVFLCLYSQETDASKEWFKDRFNDAKRAINKRFNRETLTKFLEGGPKLFAVKRNNRKLLNILLFIEESHFKGQGIVLQKVIGN